MSASDVARLASIPQNRAAAALNVAQSALSRHIDAHSHSPDFHEVPLTLEVVASELTLFDGIKSDYGKARKEWEKTKPKAATIFS